VSYWVCRWCGERTTSGFEHRCTEVDQQTTVLVSEEDGRNSREDVPAAVVTDPAVALKQELAHVVSERDRYIARCAELERRLEAIRKWCDNLERRT
jgi:hypothetical protein